MKAWRIANRKFNMLEGAGGRYVGGRWHSAGRPIVYLAEHPALAALEVLVHMDMAMADLPEYLLLKVDVPDTVEIRVIDCDPLQSDKTVAAGNRWLASGETALCRVPSAVMPHSYNYLLNPAHPDAATARIEEEMSFAFDARLFRWRA
ncbi:MAG: RES family NAD+ phosphorylase [Nitratireductor sp.]|nr:RES family NAD+ phosphorylase [Nitratireductor sp.]